MLKIVAISDTHSKHALIKQNEGDLLLYAGDLTNSGSPAESELALQWIASQKKYYKDVVFTAGNHDFFLQHYPTLIKDFAEINNIYYLQQDVATVQGLTIWGSPITPEYGAMAFNIERGHKMRRFWEQIPMEVDIVLTHCPPMYIRDQVARGDGKKVYTGCEDLANHILHRKPLIHCFGHIHEQHGVTEFNNITYVNASVLDDDYKYAYGDITLNISKPADKWKIDSIQEALL